MLLKVAFAIKKTLICKLSQCFLMRLTTSQKYWIPLLKAKYSIIWQDDLEARVTKSLLTRTSRSTTRLLFARLSTIQPLTQTSSTRCNPRIRTNFIRSWQTMN
jgi:hypothetical protein